MCKYILHFNFEEYHNQDYLSRYYNETSHEKYLTQKYDYRWRVPSDIKKTNYSQMKQP